MPAYLNNLERLGLIWFSREPIDDAIAYQVLEAQPEVLEAIKRATRAKTIQRSIHLTPFGEDFCRVCLPLDSEEMEDLSEHAPSTADPSAGGRHSGQRPQLPALTGALGLSSLDPGRVSTSDQEGRRWTT